MKSYLTVAGEGESLFEEKHSKFLTHVKPVRSAKEASAFIEAQKSRFWDAKHHVYAYRLQDGTQRFSDDGEPQGTAGMPTLDVLQKQNVTDLCLVTTRYFGGILLGAGGLVRAYSHSAALGLSAAGIVEMVPCTQALFFCDYSFYGRVPALIAKWNGTLSETDFTGKVKVSFQLPKQNVPGFTEEITALSAGRIQITETGTSYQAVPVEENSSL
ncbi:MAG TPA: YigZ family protein [Clostridiales bacterium]|nr:YigZ family protein [Clostridiales bacterium]